MKILSQSDTVRLKLQEQMKWTGAYKPTEKGNPKEEKPTVEAHFLYMELREAVLWTQNNPLFITGCKTETRCSTPPDELTEAYRQLGNNLHHTAGCHRSGIPTCPLNYKGHYVMGLFQTVSLNET